MEEALVKRVLPHSIEAEQSVIGSMLMDRDAIIAASEIVVADDFYQKQYGIMFDTMVELFNEGKPVDLVTLQDRLKEKDVPPEVCSLDFVRDILATVPTSVNVRSYATIVHEKAVLRRLIRINEEIANNCYAGKDSLETILADTEKQIFNLLESRASGDFVPIRQVALNVLDKIEQATRSKSTVTGLPTGFIDLDYRMSGLQPSDLILIAARPSMGKTAFVLNITDYIAVRRQKTCLIFSLEMSSLQMLNRVLAGMTDVNPDHLRINKPTGRELGQLEEAALRLKDLPFYLDYTVGATVEQIRAKVLLQCRLGKCDLVVVDYLHLLGGDRRKGETQEQMVGRNVRALKQLALDSNCPVLTVSQMNRACEARADKAYLPVMSDLRDSGTIEQVADCVAFIYRPERYGFTRDEKTGHSLVGVGKIYIAKNRNGSTGIARFRYNPSFTRITDYIQPGTQTSLGL